MTEKNSQCKVKNIVNRPLWFRVCFLTEWNHIAHSRHKLYCQACWGQIACDDNMYSKCTDYFCDLKNAYFCFQVCLASIGWSAGGASLCMGNLSGRQAKYTWGDALSDSPDCIGPTGSSYPSWVHSRVNLTFKSSNMIAIFASSKSSR